MSDSEKTSTSHEMIGLEPLTTRRVSFEIVEEEQMDDGDSLKVGKQQQSQDSGEPNDTTGNTNQDLNRPSGGFSKQELEKEWLSEADVECDCDNSSVDEKYDVASLASSIDDSTEGWRNRMKAVLENHWFHLLIILLVLVDALIVIFELLLDLGAFNNRLCSGHSFTEQAQFCHYLFPETCAPHSRMILDSRNISQSPGNGTGTDGLCHCGFRDGLYVCLQATEESGVNPSLVLHIFSLSILSLFLIEIVLKMIAFRLKHFLEKFEVFDAIIIVISWTIDVASLVEEETFEVAGLLIVLRLWRIIRIFNAWYALDRKEDETPKCSSYFGTVDTSKKTMHSEAHMSEVRAEARRLIHALHKAQSKINEYEEEIDNLKQHLPM